MKFVSILLVSLLSIGNFTFSKQTTKEEKVTFRIKKGFVTVNGKFSKVDYNINLNKEGIETIFGTADISSVSSGNSTRDKHLQNKEWFDATNYPKITIQSKKIVKHKEGDYTGTFDITIKGKTQVQEIPFHVISDGNDKKLKATFSLSISAFDIGGGVVDLLVGDKVTINIQLPF